MPLNTNPIESILECTSRRQLAHLLKLELADLTYLAYGRGKQYRSFTIPKKNGGERQITAPIGALLNVQKKLAALLCDVYRPPIYVQGFVKERSFSTNASVHLKKRVILNIDLNDFFHSITSNRIIGLLRKPPFNFNNEVASSIVGLTCFNGSLPQGAPTSPILSNMICLRLDIQLCALSKSTRTTYTRYADDITISTTLKNFPEQLAILNIEKYESKVSLGQNLLSIIKSNNFTINVNKTRLSANYSSKFVTGVKVNERPNLQRKYIREIRSLLNLWEKNDYDIAQTKYNDSYGNSKNLERVLRGKIAHIKNVKSESDLVYRRLYNRFVNLENRGRPYLPITEIEELYEKVFVISAFNKNGVEKTGTGFVLDNEWLITCDHVIELDNATYFNYRDFPIPSRKKITANPLMRSAEDKFDLIAFPMTISSENKNITLYSAPSNYAVSTGDIGRVIGFPSYIAGSPPHVVTIEVTAVIKDHKREIYDAFIDKKVISGNSGSPVINFKNEVIGMVCRGASSRGGADTGYIFLPIQEIRRCLNGFRSAVDRSISITE